MRSLAEMGVDVRAVQWLNEHGHDAVHLRDGGLYRLPNGQLFEKAAREQRILLTSDLDFGELAAHASGFPSAIYGLLTSSADLLC